MVKVTIDKVMPQEAAVLTELSFASKRHWRYPEHYYELWGRELTITEEYIETNRVYGARQADRLVGYYSLRTLDQDVGFAGSVLNRGIWLEHMFVRPEHIGRGVGTRLFAHLRELCCAEKIEVLHILADPNARGFYEKMHCRYIAEFPSSIAGRTTPMLIYRPNVSASPDIDSLR